MERISYANVEAIIAEQLEFAKELADRTYPGACVELGVEWVLRSEDSSFGDDRDTDFTGLCRAVASRLFGVAMERRAPFEANTDEWQTKHVDEFREEFYSAGDLFASRNSLTVTANDGHTVVRFAWPYYLDVPTPAACRWLLGLLNARNCTMELKTKAW